MSSFQRFHSGFVFTHMVRRVPDNDFGLTRSECLAQSIRDIPGVASAEVRPGKYICWWTAELKIGAKQWRMLWQIQKAIYRCCKPKNHQSRPQEYVYVDEEGEYTGLAGI